MSDHPLKQAQELYKQGRQADAQKIVVAYVYENREDAQGWWALANIATEESVKLKSLKKVLLLKPDFEPARAMLAQLESTGGTRTHPKGKKPLPPLMSDNPGPTKYSLGFYVSVLLGVFICSICACCTLGPYLLVQNLERLLEAESLGFGQYMTPVALNPQVTRAVLALDETGILTRTNIPLDTPAYVYVEFTGQQADLEVRWFRILASGQRQEISRSSATFSEWAYFLYIPDQVGRYEAEFYYQGRLERKFVFSVG